MPKEHRALEGDIRAIRAHRVIKAFRALKARKVARATRAIKGLRMSRSRSQGAQGPQGFQGPCDGVARELREPGSQGNQGFQGDRVRERKVIGDSGSYWSAGRSRSTRGFKAPRACEGQGCRGFQGDAGAQGPQGFQGVSGVALTITTSERHDLYPRARRCRARSSSPAAGNRSHGPDQCFGRLPGRTVVNIRAMGTGQITVAGAGGVTVNSSNGLKTLRPVLHGVAHEGRHQRLAMAQFLRIAEQYLYWAPFENSAIPVKDFAEQIKEARILAKELQKVVASFGSAATLVQRQWERPSHRDKSESAHETPETPIEEDKSAIFESAWDTERTQHRFFCNFRDVVRAVISVLDDTRREVMGEGLPGFSEGDAWNRLIVNLARGFRSKNLKATATKRLKSSSFCFRYFCEEIAVDVEGGVSAT